MCRELRVQSHSHNCFFDSSYNEFIKGASKLGEKSR